jgi:hypothetical protein
MMFVLTVTRCSFLPSCAESKIPALKKPDNYWGKFYTDFPERKPTATTFFPSPGVNWLEKPRSLVNQL